MHEVRQVEINVGDLISVTDVDFVCTVVEVRSDEIHITCLESSKIVQRSSYEFTYLKSPDNLRIDPTGDWSDVEKVYGISHFGSADPDPIRKNALSQLRGKTLMSDLLGLFGPSGAELLPRLLANRLCPDFEDWFFSRYGYTEEARRMLNELEDIWRSWLRAQFYGTP